MIVPFFALPSLIFYASCRTPSKAPFQSPLIASFSTLFPHFTACLPNTHFRTLLRAPLSNGAFYSTFSPPRRRVTLCRRTSRIRWHCLGVAHIRSAWCHYNCDESLSSVSYHPNQPNSRSIPLLSVSVHISWHTQSKKNGKTSTSQRSHGRRLERLYQVFRKG